MTRSACGVPLRPLDAGVDVLGVLAEDDHVHQLGTLDRRRRALEVAHRAHARVEVEHLAQRHVQAADAAAHRRRQRALDGDLVVLDRLDGVVRQPLAVLRLGLLAGRHLEPDDLALAAVGALGDRGVEHAHAGPPDVGTGAVTFDEGHDGLVGDDELAVLRGGDGRAFGRRREVHELYHGRLQHRVTNRRATIAGSHTRRDVVRCMRGPCPLGHAPLSALARHGSSQNLWKTLLKTWPVRGRASR